VTGVSELRDVAVVSAAPEAIRVSVLGGRTQLDVALPADVPVAAFLPELARLIGSRGARRDEEVVDRDERRTFWVLSRVGDDTELAPQQSLREAGIAHGEVLRISQQLALAPPTLYDDVVDAAARLNRASYAAWDATAAGAMATAGLWLCTAVWMYFLVAAPLSAHRGVVVGGALLTLVVMVGGAAVVHRALGRTDIASAAGLPVIALSGALGWVLAKNHGVVGLVAACVVLLLVALACYRLIGAGHWAYIAGAVVFAFGAVALLGAALGARAEVVAAALATIAALSCLAVPVLTAGLARSPALAVELRAARADTPFAPAQDNDSGAAMPSAEAVWAQVRSAVLTRAGVLTGLAVIVVTAATIMLRVDSYWPTFIFALTCAAVLALRSRRMRSVPERAALAVPATALVLIACAQAQSGTGSLRLGGVVVLVVIVVVATLAGLVVVGGGRPRWMPTVVAYLEYLAVAALIPVALWPLGIYDRLGL
jgi:type VII secretion integral membrane protein EccD